MSLSPEAQVLRDLLSRWPGALAELRRRIWPVPCPVCQARPGEPCGGPGSTLVPGWHTRRWDSVFSAGLAEAR